MSRPALGQHYLVDRRILHRILGAADLSSRDTVVEVGPGPGVLTRELVKAAGRVIAVEMDSALAAGLPLRLGNPDNLTVLEADARTVDLAPVLGGEAFKVVSNLPYYAASPIVRRFLEKEPGPQLMVVTVQREVAHSMAAAPGKMGLLSVGVQFYGLPRIVCTVPPTAFRPPPKVHSAVVRIDLHPKPAVDVADEVGFFALVRAGFAAPRKQLTNSLALGLGAPTAEVRELLKEVGLEPRRRPATLSLEEWAQLYEAHRRGSRA